MPKEINPERMQELQELAHEAIQEETLPASIEEIDAFLDAFLEHGDFLETFVQIKNSKQEG